MTTYNALHFCAYCKAPLDPANPQIAPIHDYDKFVCQLCSQLYETIKNSPHFYEAQQIYESQKRRLGVEGMNRGD